MHGLSGGVQSCHLTGFFLHRSSGSWSSVSYLGLTSCHTLCIWGPMIFSTDGGRMILSAKVLVGVAPSWPVWRDCLSVLCGRLPAFPMFFFQWCGSRCFQCFSGDVFLLKFLLSKEARSPFLSTFQTDQVPSSPFLEEPSLALGSLNIQDGWDSDAQGGTWGRAVEVSSPTAPALQRFLHFEDSPHLF